MPDYNTQTDLAAIIGDMQRRLRVQEVAPRTGLADTVFVSTPTWYTWHTAVDPDAWSPLDTTPANLLRVAVTGKRFIVTITGQPANFGGFGYQSDEAMMALTVDGTTSLNPPRIATVRSSSAVPVSTDAPPPLTLTTQILFDSPAEHTFEPWFSIGGGSGSGSPPSWRNVTMTVAVFS